MNKQAVKDYEQVYVNKALQIIESNTKAKQVFILFLFLSLLS